jgi:peptidoglycan biosynthesis protein MviN/MurJ (putative lipid II flippase)
MGSVTNSFRTAYGLFYKARFRPIAMVIINIVVSVILVKYLGITGVILGTIISRLLTTAWLDPYVVYKYGFKDNVKEYYKTYLYYFLIFIISGGVLYYISSLFISKNIIIWIISAFITFVLYNLIIYILFHKTEEFNYFYEKGVKFIKNKIRKEA